MTNSASIEADPTYIEEAGMFNLPVYVLLVFAAVFAVITIVSGYPAFIEGSRTPAALFAVGIITPASAWGVLCFICGAIWKADHERFHRALKIINALDLRR